MEYSTRKNDKTCPKCSSTIQSAWYYCPYCGTMLSSLADIFKVTIFNADNK